MVSMTSRALTPWWHDRRRRDRSAADVSGSRAPTAILDWTTPAVQLLIADLASPARDDRALLQRAHGAVASRVRPTYAIEERQPVSRTLARGRGSCSQRLAVLEAVARGNGISTRVRGLLVDGTFWYPRFAGLHPLLPSEVVLAWPEFLLDDGWVSASELFREQGQTLCGGARLLAGPVLGRWSAGASHAA